MLIYLTTLCVVVLTAYLATRKGVLPHESRVFFLFAFAVMVLVPALRNQTVGTDTREYVRYFGYISSFSDIIIVAVKGGEYGIWILSWLLHFISDQYFILLLAVAMIVVGCYQKAILEHSCNVAISFFIFITMGFYTFFFNGARQGLACAICALAIGPAMNGNFKKYLGYVGLAVLFHKTAIVMAPAYFVFKKANTFKTHMLYLGLGGLGILSLQKIVEITSKMEERYQEYAPSGEGGGYLISVFTCVLALFFIIMKKSIYTDRERYDFFLNMLSLGAVISMISSLTGSSPSGLLRFSVYFNVSTVFLWPIVFENQPNTWPRLIMSYLVMIGYLVFFILTTQRFSDLIPYTFNPVLDIF